MTSTFPLTRNENFLELVLPEVAERQSSNIQTGVECSKGFQKKASC